jgi:uncharacterized protein YukE
VVQAAIAESRRHQWLNEVSLGRWAMILGLQLLLLPALFFFGLSLVRTAQWPVDVVPAALVEPVITVSPGDAELERGSGLIVTARFEKQVPSAASLVIVPRHGPAQRMELTRNLNDPVFGGGLPSADADFTYRVEYGEKASRDFQVRVFEHPRLERADATLRPPAYTKLPEKQLPETRRISGVEGTKADVAFQLNKPVKAAWLQAKDGAKVALDIAGEKPAASLKDFALVASKAYELHLTDADGRENKVPESFVIDVLPNRKPELKRKLPRGDGRVSPIQEVAFEATAWDDFGLLGWGLSFTLPNGETKEVVFGKETTPDQKVDGRHLLQLEPLKIDPDELIAWHLWAEDVGPDGKPRRTAGDIYFAEVRPFEEIYRQGDEGESKSKGGKGAGEEVTKLAELQKQIIAATWNLQRRENLAAPATPAYRKDEPVIRDNQAAAIGQAEELREKLEQEKAKGFIEVALKEMREAVEKLTKAEPAPALLPDALPPEQRAYGALLKLAAHEFEVSKQKGGGGGEQKGGASQEQLDQLDLKEERNRYETKTEATEEKQQQAEQLAILNRLKELAQRQQDINERMKELQTALQEAKTDAERDEARRELKRLQEEQQRMLADIDELKQSMENASNQAELAQERKRLDETRQEAQKAGEALRQEKPTEALAAGARSERELEQLRDDFRKKSSNRFRDQMREMRQDARELAHNQEEIGKQIQAAAAPKENELKSLQGENPRERLAEQFADQQAGLDKLHKEMREVSEQAEAAEPLLARELYDSLRKSAQANTEETLKKAGILSTRGYASQARQFEEKARKEVNDLKEGVERAAESVLGDEAESLRQARSELNQLAEQINREIGRARPELADANSAAEKQTRGENGNQGQPGENETGEKAGSEKGEGKQPGAGEPGKQPGEGKQGQKPAGGKSEATAANQDSEKKGGEGKQGQGEKPGEGGGKGEQPGAKPGEAKEPGTGQQGPMAGEGKGKGQGKQPGEGQQGEGKGEGQQGKGQTAGEGKEPGQGQSGKGQGEGRMAGQGKGQGQGQQPGEGNSPSSSPGRTASRGQASGQNSSSPNEAEPGAKPGSRLRELVATGGPRPKGGIRSGGGGGGDDRGGGIDFEEGPLTGEDFVKWSDRLRNVEEMLDNRELRERVAQVREDARTVRSEFKRHSKEPQWDVVKMKIGKPLAELRDRVAEELARKDSKESLVPIDRDPVPPKYAERVRRYYEELGK